jgi:2-dehydro-3-deoxyphosphogluconate aldolase/(4S)-4-hydroxy-2-oxoglutarate aldolase
MNKADVLERVAALGLVPVVRAQSADEALTAIDAICAGGVNVFEITMTVPGAVSLIEQVVARFGADAIVGAGTVLDAETARACIEAGAQFVVSPALDLGTIDYCRQSAVAVMPGALTPTEVVTAWRAGADVVKVFPCGAVGGASYLKSLKAPLPQIALMPTGGVSLKTAAGFVEAGAFALGVGADLVDLDAIRGSQAALVTERAREYVRVVQAARAGAH